MPMLGDNVAPSTVAKNLKALKTQEQKYKEQLDLWLRGRDINKAEQEALESIEKAREEAAQIIASAKEKDAQATMDLEAAQKAHKQCEAELSNQHIKEQELNTKIEEAEAREAKAQELQVKLDAKIKSLNAEKRALTDRRKQIEEALKI